MKKMMFFLMMICLSANAWAQTSGNCGKENDADVTWSYDAATTTLTISGTGDMADFTSGAAPWNAYLSNITSVVIKSGVTSIGKYAFKGYLRLTSVSIPSGVTSIGNYAFYDCSDLTSVSIPGSVTSIGSPAFLGCSGLTDVYYNTTSPITYDSNWNLGSTANPARILHIPAEATAAFTANGWTTDVFSSISADIPAGTCGTGVSWVLVDHTLTISGTGAMADFTSGAAPWNAYLSNITSVVIKSGVTSIGASAFAWCSALTSVSIPGSVTSIGNQAFYDCSDLTSVSIPSGVTSIGVQAFFNCPALTSVSIPTIVTSIGTRVFQGCSGLTTITVDASNATYRSTGGDGNECNAILSKDGKTLFAGCKTTTIPGSVTSIENYAFYGCSGLTSVSIPSGVTSIGDQTFFGCSGLTSVSIPSGVTSIGSSAFSGCSGLTSVSIPSGVTSIGDYVFFGCTGLTSVSIPGGVTSIGVQAFRGCTGLTSVYYNTTSPITYDSNWNLGSTANPARTLHIPSGQATTFSGKGWTTSVFASISEDIYSGTCGTNVSWVLVGHTLTISGAGAMADYNSENAPWSSYSSRITSVVIESGVTSIGKYAFKGYSVLSSVSIPSGVTSIGVQAFFNCPALTSVSIPTSVISIGTRVFEGCSGVTTITVDASNTAYRSTDGVGNECNAILSKDGKTLITGCKTTTIPSGVTSIGDRAFQSCSTLTSVSIPSSVTSIGSSAFYACPGLTSVNISNSVTSIGNDAFYGCI